MVNEQFDLDIHRQTMPQQLELTHLESDQDSNQDSESKFLVHDDLGQCGQLGGWALICGCLSLVQSYTLRTSIEFLGPTCPWKGLRGLRLPKQLS